MFACKQFFGLPLFLALSFAAYYPEPQPCCTRNPTT
jgi:hypothetical protein